MSVATNLVASEMAAGTRAYNREFYNTIRGGSRRSAEVVVPIVLELMQPKSVVDVGCGDGTWLAVFRDLYVSDIVGLDGDYVDRRLLQLPENHFRATDLSSPFGLPRTFDLAVSLEVAEHLPPESAEGFVDSLTRLAPVVLFSAAIPIQGGTRHLNEQWPDYWAALFKAHDYVPIDCIRERIWRNELVEHWYAQNILIFASADRIQGDSDLRREYEKTNPQRLALVHPRQYLLAHAAGPPEYGVREASRILVQSLKNAAHKRMQHALRKV